MNKKNIKLYFVLFQLFTLIGCSNLNTMEEITQPVVSQESHLTEGEIEAKEGLKSLTLTGVEKSATSSISKTATTTKGATSTESKKATSTTVTKGATTKEESKNTTKEESKTTTGSTTSEPKSDTTKIPIFEKGIASNYGKGWDGKKSASGERIDNTKLTAAHKTLPFGTVVRVTNTKNGKSVDVRINDRGPFIKGRVIDLSNAAFSQIAKMVEGIVPVEVRIIKKVETKK